MNRSSAKGVIGQKFKTVVLRHATVPTKVELCARRTANVLTLGFDQSPVGTIGPIWKDSTSNQLVAFLFGIQFKLSLN